MRTLPLLLPHVAVGHRVPVVAVVEDVADGTARVTVGDVSVVLTAEQVRLAEVAVGEADRWDARMRARRAG